MYLLIPLDRRKADLRGSPHEYLVREALPPSRQALRCRCVLSDDLSVDRRVHPWDLPQGSENRRGRVQQVGAAGLGWNRVRKERQGGSCETRAHRFVADE